MNFLIEFYQSNSAVINTVLLAFVIDLIGSYIAKNPNNKATSILSYILDFLKTKLKK